jgi:putative ABC transport system permease protein
MMWRVCFREARRSLMASKQRTLLALLGIIIGIASVIAMVSIGTIVKAEALRQFQDMGTDFLLITGLGGGGKETRPPVQMKSVPAILRACPSLTAVAPYGTGFGQVRYRGQLWSTSVMGVTGSFHRVNRLSLAKGRALSDLDQEMYNCVLGERMARQLHTLGITNPVGLKVSIMDRIFTVVGALNHATDNALRPAEINDGILVPYWTLERITGVDKVETIVARMRQGLDTSRPVMELNRVLLKVLSGQEPRIRTAQELIQQMNRQMNLLTLLLGVVGSIALVVGGVGVMNVMLVSVTERRREIGIRRALGAQQGDIQWQFLIESLLLCLIGGAVGIGLGVGGAYLVSQYQQWHFLLSKEATVLGFGVSAMVGMFFGIYPARQASKLRVIDALRAS